MGSAAVKLDPVAEPKPIAEHLAKKQREISVSEFFAKNRHLLGFDNPRKALLTTVKEAVDNSLDACEEAKILPEIEVRVEVAGNGDPRPPASQAERFVVTVTDNGPGIVKQQIPRVFGKLLYGSKFHRLRMSRGQQGIGISAAGMYSLLTTGKPIRITSRICETKRTHYFEIQIDTTRNEANTLKEEEIDWDRPHGTKVELEIVGKYQKGRLSVDEYLEQTAISNSHLHLVYKDPEGNTTDFPRTVNELPREPREIKPHPYGVELGVMMKMLQDTNSRTLSGFLQSDFSRVSPAVAGAICAAAKLEPNMRPSRVAAQEAETLHRAISSVRIMNPPTDVLSPIGEKAILAGMYKQIRGDFYTAVTRSPAVYRGNPFAIEVGLAYGTGQGAMTPKLEEQDLALPVAEGEEKEREVQLARLMRFANRVPLLYQQGACCTFKTVVETAWRNYGISQSKGALPQGPLVIFVHMASVWVPFTSESKEAIADYDEIRKEIKLALQEAGRRLCAFVRRRERAELELKRRDVFEAYIEEVAAACGRLRKGKLDEERLKKQLAAIAHSKTGGEKTDEIAGAKEEEPAVESTIIVTTEGPVGLVPSEPAALLRASRSGGQAGGRVEGAIPEEKKDEPKRDDGRGKARRAR